MVGRTREDSSSDVQPSAFNLQPLLALSLSILFHGLIAAGIALYISYAPVPDELAQLDLTSIDLSFAETPDETAQAVPAAAPVLRPPSAAESCASEADALRDDLSAANPVLPKPDTSDLPKPDEPREQLETPPPQPTTLNPQPTTPVAPRQAKVDAPPKPRRNIRPDYPRESRLRGEQGDVTLEIDVSAQGSVDDVRVVKSSGFPLLDEAAVKAARAARFTPAKSGGKTIPSVVRLPLSFRLE